MILLAALFALAQLAPSRVQGDPVVFNATQSARPGDIVSIQGENFGSAPEVWLGETRLTIENSAGTGWVAVRIPADARGALVVRVKNGTATSAPVALNKARPLHLDTLEIWAGGGFRIFGRNLLLPGSTPTVTVDGNPATIDLARSDEHMLTAVAPNGFRNMPGNVITVDNGNGSGPSDLLRPIEIVAVKATDPYQVGVGWTSGLPYDRVVPVALGDDLQAAIDKTRIGTLQLPEGTFTISKPLTLRSHLVLQGAGKDKTILRYEKSNYPIFASGRDHIGLRDLSIVNAGADIEGPLIKGNTHVLLQNVRFDLGVSQQMYLSGNRNIVVTGCDFIQRGSLRGQGPYQFSNSAGLVFTRNTTLWKDGAPSFQESHDAYIADNRWTRDASVQHTPVITTHCCVIDFCARVAVVGNTFDVINGPIVNRERNDGETLLTEGGGGKRTENLGAVESATRFTLTDSKNTIDVNPFEKNRIPENYGVAIVDGRGAGQTRRVTAYAQKTLTVERAWDVVPDETSRYATFVWGLEQSLLKGNVLKGNPRGIWLYHCAVRDVDVVGNVLEEGGGIYLRTWQSVADRQFTPIYNVRIAGNTVSNTTGVWVSHIGAVYVLKEARPFGLGQVGIEVRDNRLTANAKNLQLNGEDYASLEGYYSLLKPESGKFEPGALAPMLGTIYERNRAANCDAAFRIGTGTEGFVLSGNTLLDCKQAVVEVAAHAGMPTSKGTIVR